MIHQPMLSMFASSNAGLCPPTYPKNWGTTLHKSLRCILCSTTFTMQRYVRYVFITISLPFFTDKSLSFSPVAHQIYHQVISWSIINPWNFATEKHSALFDVLRDHQQTSRASPTAAHFGGGPPKANDVRMVQLWKPWCMDLIMFLPLAVLSP